MKIVIGHYFDSITGQKVGEEIILTDPGAQPLPQHPALSRTVADMHEFLSHLNANPQAREAGGWHQVTVLEGETQGKTKWQRVVDAVNHPDADPRLKALQLKSGKEVLIT